MTCPRAGGCYLGVCSGKPVLFPLPLHPSAVPSRALAVMRSVSSGGGNEEALPPGDCRSGKHRDLQQRESFFGGRTWHFLSQHEITQDKGHKLSASSPKYIPLKPHWSLLQNTEWNFNIQQYFDTSCYSNLLPFFHSCFCSLELLFKSSLFILLSTDLASSLDFYGLWGCRSVCAQN